MILYFQRCLIGVGAALLVLFAMGQVHSSAGRQQALDAFRVAQAAQPPAGAEDNYARHEPGAPNQVLWAEARIQAYHDSLKVDAQSPKGVLRVDTLDLQVPIFTGTSEFNLNRGVGWIEGTAALGEAGNVGIAGHRDGFFRVLKDISVGDFIDIESLAGSRRYRVLETLIVDPADVYVLDPTQEPSVTLVTCYPFYFVGHAPQRFIVRGVLADADPG